MQRKRLNEGKQNIEGSISKNKTACFIYQRQCNKSENTDKYKRSFKE